MINPKISDSTTFKKLKNRYSSIIISHKIYKNFSLTPNENLYYFLLPNLPVWQIIFSVISCLEIKVPYFKIYRITIIITKEIYLILYLSLSLSKISNRLHLSNSRKWLLSKRIQYGLLSLGKIVIEEMVYLL